MASFDFGKLSPEPGNLASELNLVHYRGEQCLDEILDWAFDNYQFDCKALEESVKSEDRADMLRLHGNQCYEAKNYLQALDSYNKSIIAAPHPVLSNVRIEETESDAEFGFPRIDPARYGGVALEKCSALGKGFANRSAVMLDIGAYEKCLEDIDLALEYGYPEELRPKLEARRLKCQEAQRREKESNCSQRDFVDNVDRFALRDFLKNLKYNLTLKPPVIKDPNPCIPAFSSAVRVSYWPNKGRGLVATRDIKPGEVLGVERAFAFVFQQDLHATHCSVCALLVANPLPCPGCSQVVFCSKSCRVKGLSEDHWLECKILSSVRVHGLGKMELSYKLLKTWNFSQMKSMYNKLKMDKPTIPEQLGFNKSGKYNSSSFQSVYHLRQNLEVLSVEVVISICMDAFQLARLLELSKRFFVNESGKPVPVTKEDVLDTCKILVSNFAKFQVSELCPVTSLFNHSCFPVASWELEEMASFDFGRLAPKLTLVHYRGEQCLDEILDWAWDNDQFDCKALEESVKSEDRADMLRLLGNECYKAKKYAKALDSYNLSIMAAPHPVLSNVRIEETEGDAEFGFPRIDPARYGGVALEKCSALGKGFANRSAVMLDIGAYEKCLEDIDLALEYGYPEELRPKLEARRLKCQEVQRREKESNCSRRNFADENLESCILSDLLRQVKFYQALKPPVMKDPNPCMPAVSSAVKVSYWPDKGRGFVATKDIKPGEVLGVERSFAAVLEQDLLTTNCSTCTLLCVNPLPCPGCSQVVFCSKSCRVKGLSEDHWLECKILSSVLAYGLGTLARSYKLLKTWNFNQIKSMHNKLKMDKPILPEQLGFDKSGKYRSSSFQSVYHLLQGLETFPFEEVISECMNAFRLARLLEFSKRFFVNESGVPEPVTKEDFLETCKILVNNYAKFTQNSFVSQERGVFELYPAKSLINHSCSPVMSSKRFGRESFWYAVRPVAAGEELTISYVADFSIEPKQERKGKLVPVHNIVCSCQACEESWPTLPHLPGIVCSCVNCKKPFPDVGMYCHECFERLRGKLDIKTAFELRIISEKVMSALDVLQRMQNKVAQEEPISKQEFRHLCGASEVAFKYSTSPSKALVSFMKLMDVCAENGLM
ncbi:uncharacterized protein [Macrobrachium rosenbergii]|uniref:uncharacterized protein isoform X2 n=1 Tax=Macrobrachium rosenbergii TaxID=79674 RepID=UPI0034D3B635